LKIRFISRLGAQRFDPSIETACFRVAQEAVTNIIRHAGAKHATVEIMREGNTLRLTVMDDGDGFDVASVRASAARGESFGLISIEERLALVGGRLILASTPGQGTQIIALVSAPSQPAAQAAEPGLKMTAGEH
jgi:signal transduction histidine kinase